MNGDTKSVIRVKKAIFQIVCHAPAQAGLILWTGQSRKAKVELQFELPFGMKLYAVHI